MVKLDFTKFKPSQGKLLISEPFSQDPNFKRTVVLLTSHNDEGSVGFVLNRSMPARDGTGGELKLEQIIEDFNDISFPIWDGGPVQRDSLFYIHTLGDAIPESQPIAGDLYWGGNFETVKALIKGGKIGEGELRMFIGYSGWSAGQLQDEIKSNCWLVTPATLDLVMNYPLSLGAGDKTGVDKFWRLAVKGMGKEYAALVNFPENPMWN